MFVPDRVNAVHATRVIGAAETVAVAAVGVGEVLPQRDARAVRGNVGQ